MVPAAVHFRGYGFKGTGTYVPIQACEVANVRAKTDWPCTYLWNKWSLRFRSQAELVPAHTVQEYLDDNNGKLT